MEFGENEEQEEEIGMHENYQTLGISAGKGSGCTYRYKECLKNHAVGIGGYAVDGCREFMAAGEEGTLESLKCAACNCHRNFHRKETDGEGFDQPHPSTSHYHQHQHHSQYHPFPSSYSVRTLSHPSGYLHHIPPTNRPLALPSTSREDEDVSNPSSSGGGGGSLGGTVAGGLKKRHRSKFTQEQKEKMLGFAERVGWRILKQDQDLVQQFCAEINVKRHVLKVWMHNNKHTLGKKP
ncbi:hypothetical protein ACH5RR_026962 [Cinchona calisaya]|uniref:ZF-HD dimerization-type domain-containing protein n=1 Tax=Cinchona calisaya TaxID=153742 RepID=A0ABD2Z7E9_9GENT